MMSRHGSSIAGATRLCAAVAAAVALGAAVATAAAPSPLDPTFAHGGIVTTRIGLHASASVLTLDRNGWIIVVGQTWKSEGTYAQLGDFAIARYRPDGRLDRSFGSGGHTVTRFPGGAGIPYAVVVAADGRIVVAGAATTPTGNYPTAFALARYDRHGRLDRAFGENGIVTTAFADATRTWITALRVGADGSLLAAGPASNGRIALARYTADGHLDSGFANQGTLLVDFAPGGDVATVVTGRDGTFVAGGSSDVTTSSSDFALARYLPDGSRDLSFGRSGLVTMDFGQYDRVGAMAVAPNGKVVAVDSSYLWCTGVVGESEECTPMAVVARFRPDGTVDTAFGGRIGGRLLPSNLSALAVAVAADGGIAVAGDGYVTAACSWAAECDHPFSYLAVFKDNGSPDRRLTPTSAVSTDITGGHGFHQNAVKWDHKGRIVVAGDASGKFALARYRLLPR